MTSSLDDDCIALLHWMLFPFLYGFSFKFDYLSAFNPQLWIWENFHCIPNVMKIAGIDHNCSLLPEKYKK